MILDKEEREWKEEAPKDVSGSPVFVIQMGLSAVPCYDFWLEVDGTLQLWRIHGGNSAEKQQTKFPNQSNETMVESFNWEEFSLGDEARLGPEIIWDAGEYRYLGEDNGGIRSALEAGKIQIWLDGERFKGEYLLVRTSDEEDPTWLLLGTTNMNDTALLAPGLKIGEYR